MIPDNIGTRLIRDSIIIAFVVGVAASFYANSLSSAHANGRYSVVVALLLAGLLLIASWTAGVLLFEVKRLRHECIAGGIAGCRVRSTDKLSLAHVLDEARSEICFLGITAKRSFSDDQFKVFLINHADRNVRLRVLLLDPHSEAFSRRAQEERESVESWKQELAATINKIQHYRQIYGAQIEVRFYDIYPVLRLLVVDNRKIVANFFLEGRRGTESSQVSFEDSASDLASHFIKWFNVIWQYHSKAVDYENYTTKD